MLYLSLAAPLKSVRLQGLDVASSRGGPMRRREFITLVGGLAACPIGATAQQAMPVVGCLSAGTAEGFADLLAAFRRGLSEAGFVDGRNVAIEYRWAEEGQYDRLPKLAADLVDRQVAVMFANPIPAALAAKTATATVPIVFAIGSDPVASGLVASMNRPGGNITGVSLLSVELGAKRLELVRELVPNTATMALLVNPNNPSAAAQAKEMRSAAATLGLQSNVLSVDSQKDLDAVFATLVRQRDGALVVSADPFFVSQRDQLVELAARYRVPAIYWIREFAAAGGLMSYGASFADGYRQAGVYAGRILRGERPADLPVVQPTKFELVINLKAAKALGLTLPAGLLSVADEVIE
jgi:putative ABC transport system substrate-binding protein